MTREEQITFKAGGIADGCIAHGAPWKNYYQGFIEGAKWADANPPQPSLPSNLDEAAEESMPEEEGFLEIDIYGGSETVYSREQMLAMFKAGAEWMAGQGYVKEGIARPDDCEIWVNMTNTDIKDGDEVIVQIRKK
jgi:hypothetical protein